MTVDIALLIRLVQGTLIESTASISLLVTSDRIQVSLNRKGNLLAHLVTNLQA